MKTIALLTALVISSTLALDPIPASAISTKDWIQMGISAANTARKVSKTRSGSNTATAYGQNNNAGGSKPLLPKFLRRR